MENKFIYSCANVRALLGVSEDELPDTTILLEVYTTQVANEIDQLNSKLEETFDAIVAKIEQYKADNTKEVPTRLEKKIVGSTQVYATYRVALLLADALGMSGLQKISDGKAEGIRTANAQEATRLNLLQKASEIENELLENLVAYGVEKDPVTFVFPIGSAGLGTDPVTGA